MPDLGIDLDNHPGLARLDERERLLVRTAVRDDRLFREWVLADILDRRSMCSSHHDRIRKLERIRRLVLAGISAVVAVGGAVAAWLGLRS